MNDNQNLYDEVFAFIIPTGIGASIGGFAGDGSFWARKFASIRPTIVNANVVNAACFSGINENILYAEGWGIDELFEGNLKFVPSKNNKIGIIFDKAIPKDVLNIHLNTINAVKTVYGIDIAGYEITKKEVGVEYKIDETGVSTGIVKTPETLLEAGEKLIKNGAETLAVVCLFPDEDEIDGMEKAGEDYAQNGGVDPIGGIESVISRYISKNLFVPCVHAPAFKDYQIKPDLVDPRAAAEYITPTFLPCLLLGLNNVPLYVKSGKNKSGRLEKNEIIVHNIKALIVPSSALGSPAVINAVQEKIPVYAVRENKTTLNVTKDTFFEKNSIIETDTYEELYRILRQKYENK